MRGWLLEQIERVPQEDCEDNHRLAVAGNAADEAEFRTRADDGCCGSDEYEWTHPSGVTFIYGRNYGH